MSGTMYDSLSTVTPDYSLVVLNVPAQREMIEEVPLDGQEVHEGLGVAEEVAELSTGRRFLVTIPWESLSAAQAGVIFDLYHDPDKACGTARSFKWINSVPDDGHTYVVYFAGKLSRGLQPSGWQKFEAAVLEVAGRAP